MLRFWLKIKLVLRSTFRSWPNVVMFVVVFFVSFELLLNIASWCMHHRRHSRWTQTLENKRDLTIMCIGESTTYGSYPEELQQMLREKLPDIDIEVIDLGRPGMNSTFIQKQFERDLDRFAPDIVISMLGINDGYAFMDLNSHPMTALPGQSHWWNRLRTVRFLRLLFSGYFSRKYTEKPKDESIDKSKMTRMKCMQEKIAASIKQYPEILKCEPWYKNSLEDTKIEKINYELTSDRQKNCESLKFIISEHPLCLQAYYDLAQIYVADQDYDSTMWVYDQLYEAFSNTSFSFEDVSLFYNFAIKREQREQAAKIVKQLIKDGCCDNVVYDKLSYAWYDKKQKILDLYRARIVQNPLDIFNYFQLGAYYKHFAMYDQARELFDFIVEVFNHGSSDVVVRSYLAHIEVLKALGKNDQIPALIKSITQKYPVDFSLCYWRVLGVDALEQQDEVLADEYFSLVSDFGQNYFNPETQANYLRICKLALDRNLVLIAMQYPLRKIGPLKAMLGKYADRILFLSNYDCFKKAVMEKGYSVVFSDQFGGDFGHVTPEGKKLLADNIARFLCRVIDAGDV